MTDNRPKPTRQRLSKTDILAAFAAMGYTTEDLESDRIRLMTDMSFAKEWQHPSWMMYACRLSDCDVAGELQYVTRDGDICTWCSRYALQDYM